MRQFHRSMLFDCPLSVCFFQNKQFRQTRRSMGILFDFELHIVGKTRVQHIARRRAVARYGMVGNGFHAIHNVVRCCLTVFRRLGELAFVRGKRSVVILGNDGLYSGFVVIGCSRRQIGQASKSREIMRFIEIFPKCFIEKRYCLLQAV